MNKILEKIMELGAMEDRACSETERKLIINEAEDLYKKHLAELNLLNIPDVIECLQQVNATLERHGKIDANTDLHNKIRNTL